MRRTNEQRQQDLEYLKRLLDLGASFNCIVSYSMSLGLSRAQSYRDALEAQEQRGQEGLKPLEIPSFEMRDTCIRLVCQGLFRAEADNNLEAMCKLSKEFRSLLALGRIDQKENLTNYIFSSHIENDPTPPQPPTNDTTKETPREEVRRASESGDWKTYFNSFTETP